MCIHMQRDHNSHMYVKFKLVKDHVHLVLLINVTVRARWITETPK